MEDARRLVQQAAGAGISAALEPDDPVPDGLQSDDSRLAVHSQSAELCTPDAARSAAQSCAAPELQGAEARLVVSAQELVVRLAELCSPARP